MLHTFPTESVEPDTEPQTKKRKTHWAINSAVLLLHCAIKRMSGWTIYSSRQCNTTCKTNVQFDCTDLFCRASLCVRSGERIHSAPQKIKYGKIFRVHGVRVVLPSVDHDEYG